MSDLDVFEDALFTVFGHHQPARGDPGSVGSYSNHKLPTWCEENGEKQIHYRIADLSSTNTKLFAHHQWDAGVYLADIVCEPCEWADVRGRQVVELGAGTGLPSLAATAVGAKRTIVTDYPDPDLLANLRQNVAKLKSRAPYALALDVEGVAWGQDIDS
ncbi:nicotinamide N-methyltransferase [Malassezia psittaci]|uniref:Nicotinamide N-methyltransferase n=1 Tax=Malassezia psittaci TaxID=1821823 RepID=A0AAF0FD92_9BASI|nr:nicotinamide N-methyltransferase [Malassezia psittaci]